MHSTMLTYAHRSSAVALLAMVVAERARRPAPAPCLSTASVHRASALEERMPAGRDSAGVAVTNVKCSWADISIPEAQFADAVNIRSNFIADTSGQFSQMARYGGLCARSKWRLAYQGRLLTTQTAG